MSYDKNFKQKEDEKSAELEKDQIGLKEEKIEIVHLKKDVTHISVWSIDDIDIQHWLDDGWEKVSEPIHKA